MIKVYTYPEKTNHIEECLPSTETALALSLMQGFCINYLLSCKWLEKLHRWKKKSLT
jgi:hypothetical protein